jgi:hypothetical protein
VSTFRALVALTALLGACNTEPTCEEIQLSDLQVETTAEGPVFRWQGEAAELRVERLDELAWSIRCNCLAEERDPDRNSGCQDTERDHEFRHCLTGPVRYGETPDVETLLEADDYDATMEQLEPLPLVSGQDYEVTVTAFCAPGPGSEPRNFIQRRASFEAP